VGIYLRRRLDGGCALARGRVKEKSGGRRTVRIREGKGKDEARGVESGSDSTVGDEAGRSGLKERRGKGKKSYEEREGKIGH